MKILKFFAAAVVVAAMTASCAGEAKDGKVLLASAEDSLSYATGMVIAQEYKTTMTMPHVTDSLYRSDFLKGVADAAGMNLDKVQKARITGIQTVFQLGEVVKDVNRISYGGEKPEGVSLDVTAESFIKVLKGEDPGMTGDEADAYMHDRNRTADPVLLARATGITLADGMLQNDVLANRLGIEEDQVAEFLKGMEEGQRLFANENNKAHAAGLVAGVYLKNQRLPFYSRLYFENDSTKTLNLDIALAAFCHAHGSGQLQMTEREASNCQKRFTHALIADKYADNKTSGQQFLEENKTKEGVQITASGLQYKVLKMGDGPRPTFSDVVKVHYEGRLVDGTVFDSSLARGDPMNLPLRECIDGWAEALQLMPVGSEWELYIPQELAYGNESAGETVKPFSTLIYRVQLLDIINKK